MSQEDERECHLLYSDYKRLILFLFLITFGLFFHSVIPRDYITNILLQTVGGVWKELNKLKIYFDFEEQHVKKEKKNQASENFYTIFSLRCIFISELKNYVYVTDILILILVKDILKKFDIFLKVQLKRNMVFFKIYFFGICN